MSFTRSLRWGESDMATHSVCPIMLCIYARVRFYTLKVLTFVLMHHSEFGGLRLHCRIFGSILKRGVVIRGWNSVSISEWKGAPGSQSR